jgi:hypothetical protein
VKPTRASNLALLIPCRGKGLAIFNDLGSKRDLSDHYIKTASLSTNLYARHLNRILNITREYMDKAPSEIPLVIPVYVAGVPACFIAQLLICSQQTWHSVCSVTGNIWSGKVRNEGRSYASIPPYGFTACTYRDNTACILVRLQTAVSYVLEKAVLDGRQLWARCNTPMAYTRTFPFTTVT